ncbi:MAG: L,D-transpeptidase family protein [Sedimentisphaerales bacterium]|nr:L,D-transpeptidase family protein [Sedimentisphaerales bacterium]
MAGKQMFSKKNSTVSWLLLLLVIAFAGVVIYRYSIEDSGDSADEAAQQDAVQLVNDGQDAGSAGVASESRPAGVQSSRENRAHQDAGSANPSNQETARLTAVEPMANAEPTAVQPAPVVRSANQVGFPGDSLFRQGLDAWQNEDVLGARDCLSAAVNAGLSDQDDLAARAILNQCADLWLFSSRVYEGDSCCRRYTVRSGDLLANIGRDCGVPYALLMRLNNISRPESLQAGQSLKVVQGPFHLAVDRDRCLMSVYLGDILVRSYPVGLGAPGRDTPIGLWRAAEGRKQLNPAWTDPDTGEHFYADDPQNPLGSRWIGLEGLSGDAEGRVGFGIHGTINPEEIGRAVSRGCIRLHNHDVEELYDMVSDGVSEVQVY